MVQNISARPVQTAAGAITDEMHDKDTGFSPQFDNDIIADDLTPDAIIEHLAEKEESFKAIPHERILDKLIKAVEDVDFRELAGIEEDDKLSQKHIIVHAVEQVLELAKKMNWGICIQNGFVYLYNGAFWRELEPAVIQSFLGEAAEKMGIDKHDARFYQFREKLYKQFLAVANLPSPEPSTDTVLVNAMNGTYEISPTHQKLRNPRREDFQKYQLPFSIDPSAAAPMFQDYLNTVLPDKQCQDILAEFLAYVFIPHEHLRLEKALLLYGTGANGKSVFFSIAWALLGATNVSCFSLSSLTNEDGYSRASLANKLVNYATEINGKIETSYFKQLVSGEPIEARLPYGKPFLLTNPAKLIFNCNDLPRDVEHSHAYFRRFLIVPFTVTIADDKQDKQLAQKIIKAELSGVFNWVMKGLHRLLKAQNFTDSVKVKDEVEKYRIQSDSVKMFIQENRYERDPEKYVMIVELYSDYKKFCMDDGYQPVGKSKFIQRLKNDSVIIEKKNVGNVAYLIKSVIV